MLKKKISVSPGLSMEGYSLPSECCPFILEGDKEKKGMKIWSLGVLVMMIACSDRSVADTLMTLLKNNTHCW